MRLFIYSFVFIIILGSKSHSDVFLSLTKYLQINKDYEDKGRTVYLLKRCTSVHYFLSNNKFKKKDQNIRLRYEKDYNFFSDKLYKILNKKSSDITKLNNLVDDDILKLSNIYEKNGKKSLLETGSYFKKNFIIEDLKICSKIQ